MTPADMGGKYRGLTQIGLEQSAYATIQDMPIPQQIAAYGDWLKSYDVVNKVRNAGVDFGTLSPFEQAAYLQAVQFGPNALDWQRQFAAGNRDVNITSAPQAPEMGPGGYPTMNSLIQYYQNMNNNPPY